MKLALNPSLIALAVIASSSAALIACLNSPSSDETGSQESANTADGGGEADDGGDGVRRLVSPTLRRSDVGWGRTLFGLLSQLAKQILDGVGHG